MVARVSIVVSASYQKNAQRSKFDFFKKEGDFFTTALAGVKLTVPIFDGFARKAWLDILVYCPRSFSC